jgi:tyrosyl-tRNA synthetase
MGKSLGNYIGISEAPYEMMKKFMQLSDECMRMYFELLTDIPMDRVESILGGHPKEAKLTLGRAIITEYHDAAAAQAAADQWEREIGGGALPADIPVVEVKRCDLGGDGTLPAANLLKLTGLCDSTSEARRAIQQGGAKLGEDKLRIESHDQPIAVTDGLLLWVGKKRFCRVTLAGG